MLEALERVDWSKLTSSQKIDYLRAYQLTFIRMGQPEAEWKETSRQTDRCLVSRHGLATMNREVNAELCKLICYLETPQGVTKTLALMAKAPTQEEQIEYALSLRTVKKGWTIKQREEYFNWFHKCIPALAAATVSRVPVQHPQRCSQPLTKGERADLQEVLARFPSRPPRSSAPSRVRWSRNGPWRNCCRSWRKD